MTVANRVPNATVALEGHEKRPCENCGEDVVVNPATLESIRSGEYPDFVACLACVVEDADGGP